MTSKHPERTRPTMRCVKDGPIVVQSLETMTDHDGTALPTTPSMALCRCGQSRTKPLCDGSHTAAGFSDKKTTDGRRDTQVHYGWRGHHHPRQPRGLFHAGYREIFASRSFSDDSMLIKIVVAPNVAPRTCRRPPRPPPLVARHLASATISRPLAAIQPPTKLARLFGVGPWVIEVQELPRRRSETPGPETR